MHGLRLEAKVEAGEEMKVVEAAGVVGEELLVDEHHLQDAAQ